MWFAVFLWARNETEPDPYDGGQFDIVDTQGDQVLPGSDQQPGESVRVDIRVTLKPLGIEPVPDSTAYFGPHAGIAAAVQAEQLRLLQPTVDAADLCPGAGEAVNGIA